MISAYLRLLQRLSGGHALCAAHWSDWMDAIVTHNSKKRHCAIVRSKAFWPIYYCANTNQVCSFWIQWQKIAVKNLKHIEILYLKIKVENRLLKKNQSSQIQKKMIRNSTNEIWSCSISKRPNSDGLTACFSMRSNHTNNQKKSYYVLQSATVCCQSCKGMGQNKLVAWVLSDQWVLSDWLMLVWLDISGILDA